MSTRFVKGAARTETPRLKDLGIPETARDPSAGRDEHGHFAPGNPHAIGQGIKALIRKGLGDPADPLVREATRLYLAILRSLPADGPGVRSLVAAQARNITLATHLSNEAVKAGLSTKMGLKLAEAARAHDTTAQRLSVTAYDRATREAAKQTRPVYAVDRIRALVSGKEPAK